jgi:hypothetical protein
VHQYRVLDLDGSRYVWAPTTWAVLPDEVQPTFGAKRCGLVILDLDDDAAVAAQLVEPDGLRSSPCSATSPTPTTADSRARPRHRLHP